MVRHFQTSVMYSYILVGPIFGTFKVFSDVFVLWGVWRVLIRYKKLRPTMKESTSQTLTTAAGGLLWSLAFYQYCLLFALSFAWLSFADLGVINSIAQGRNGFDVAFTALQFCSMIITATWAVLEAQKTTIVRSTVEDEWIGPLYEVRSLYSAFLLKKPNFLHRLRNFGWLLHPSSS
jgi:hypothetical protein